jgi:hypothetical protein
MNLARVVIAAVGIACVLAVALSRTVLNNSKSQNFLQQTDLFIVPEANVLSGVGQMKPKSLKISNLKKATQSENPVRKKHDITDPSNWSKAMLKVERRVLRQIRKQRKEREAAATQVAELSYRDKLSSSLYSENRRMKQLASQERAARNRESLQAAEDSTSALVHEKQIHQRVEAKSSEISQERLREDTDGSETLQQYARVGAEGLHRLHRVREEDGIGSFTAPTGSWLNTNT